MRERRWKKAVSGMLGAVLAIGLTACGGNSGGGSEGATQEGASATELNIVLFDNLTNQGISALSHEFEEKTGIKANITLLGQDVAEKRMQLDFIGNTGALDVAYMSFIMMQSWVKAGWVVPLDEYIQANTDVEMDDFATAPVESLSLNGQIWALPSFAETGLMAYRQDILESKGIATPPDTWTEFMDAAKAIHTNETAAVALRGKRGQGLNMFIFPSMMWGFGGSYFKNYPDDMTPILDRPENVEALRFYSDLVQNYSPQGASNFSFAEVISAYQQGKAAMTVDGTSIISQLFDRETSKYAEQTKVALVPQGPGGRSPMIAVHGLAIPKSSDKKEAAFEFIKWATSAEVQKKVAMNDYWMDFTRNSVAEDPEIVQKYDLDGGNFMKLRSESLNLARSDYRPLIPEWPQIGDIIAAQVNAAATGAASAEVVLKEANKQVAEVLKNAGYDQ
ncbi:ABC transporter substrate-binding protein [Cohnella hongkongensis]|uniref:ABC transporter substrate-binding protein n=1 Tax=Cohnella hongkongensis TaxID=178337 RepID=A0ABV9FJ50_9BACL